MGVLMCTVALCAPISSFMKFHQCCGLLWCPLQGQDRQMSLCTTALAVVYVNNTLAHECMERDNLYMFYLFSNFCNVTGCMNAVCHVR